MDLIYWLVRSTSLKGAGDWLKEVDGGNLYLASCEYYLSEYIKIKCKIHVIISISITSYIPLWQAILFISFECLVWKETKIVGSSFSKILWYRQIDILLLYYKYNVICKFLQ